MSADSPIVDEVRRRASEISKRHEDDLRRYADHLKDLQSQFQTQLVNQITVVPAAKRPEQTH